MISIIVAVAKNGMIGKDNDFPWYISDDLKRFRRLTTGHTIIMGRATYDHLMARIGKPLPNRTNIVVTRNPQFAAKDVTVAHSINEAFKLAHADTEEVFIIGGAQMYASCLPYADRVYVTEIDAEFEGDAFFPVLQPGTWQETSREAHQKDDKNQYDYAFVTLERKK